MKLLHILNPRTFLLPDFQEFMLKALSTSPFIFALDSYVWLAKQVLNPNIGLFVTVDERGRYHGMVIVGNSTIPLSPGCMALHFYNEGADAQSRKLLIQVAVQFAKAHGCDKIRGSDTNGKPKAFARLFKEAGPVTPRGQIFEFDISEDENSG